MNTKLHRSISYWEADTFFRPTDLLIIGAGIVGLNAAITVKRARPSWKVKVVERASIPAGASTRNAGFACFGSPSEILDDLKDSPEQEVFATVERRYEGLLALQKELGKETIQYEACGGSEVFGANEKDLYEYCLDHLEYLNRRTQSITGLAQTYSADPERLQLQGPAGFSYLIQNGAEGAIHPGKMMEALLRKAQALGVEFLFGTEVEALETAAQQVAVRFADVGYIQVERVLVTNNGFSKQLLPELPVEQVRNQVWVTEPIPRLAMQGCFHYDRGYFYFRNIGKRILLGGGRHLDQEREKTDAFGRTPQIQNALRHLLEQQILPKEWPSPKIDYKWSGILGVGSQKSPIIRRLEDRLGVAVRLGGMGVAIGTLVGQEAGNLMVQ